MLDLGTLGRYAGEAELMPVDAVLRGQCIEFANYIRGKRWHHESRELAKSLAERFEAVAHGGRTAPPRRRRLRK